jgi:hypothetical protein
MCILEHLSRHSHSFNTFFCAGKVFPSMDGAFYRSKKGNFLELSFLTDISGKFLHSLFLKDISGKFPHSRRKNVLGNLPLPGSF